MVMNYVGLTECCIAMLYFQGMKDNHHHRPHCSCNSLDVTV